MNNPSDHLLYVLSAKVELNWPAFKKTVDEILQDRIASAKHIPTLRNRVLRLLDAFGFCDVSFEKGNGSVYVCPSAIVRLPIQRCSAILIGSRSPATLDHLNRVKEKHPAVTITVNSGSDSSLLPSRIAIECEDPRLLQQFADSAQVPFQQEPTSWALAQVAADIDCYWRSLEWTDGPDLNWRSWEFNPEYCEFQDRSTEGGGLRLVRYLSPVTNIL
jgi:hypothetical protein